MINVRNDSNVLQFVSIYILSLTIYRCLYTYMKLISSAVCLLHFFSACHFYFYSLDVRLLFFVPVSLSFILSRFCFCLVVSSISVICRTFHWHTHIHMCTSSHIYGLVTCDKTYSIIIIMSVI